MYQSFALKTVDPSIAISDIMMNFLFFAEDAHIRKKRQFTLLQGGLGSFAGCYFSPNQWACRNRKFWSSLPKIMISDEFRANL